MGHKETRIHFKRFLTSDEENLQEEFSLRTQALATSLSLVLLLEHDPPAHKCFFCSLILKHACEYFRATRALAPFSPTPMSFNTTSTFTALHHESDGYFLFFLNDYEPDQNLKLFFYSFKLTFQCMPHMLANGPSRMVFEHLWDRFHPKDLTSGFPQLFQLCFHIVKGHIPS
jgi:hypothetical protein